MSSNNNVLKLVNSLENELVSVLKKLEKTKKVLIFGCFDLLHSGHISFFEEASKLGNVFVIICNDSNIISIKKRKAILKQEERLHILKNIKHIFNVRISNGSGILYFEDDIKQIKPDILYVNNNCSKEILIKKEELCKKYNLEFKIHKQSLNSISSDDIINICYEINMESKYNSDLTFPWRICLAGGWLDQKWVSCMCDGCVITVNVYHNPKFKTRSGLGTSSRDCGIKLWNKKKAPNNLTCIEAAKLLFGAENPPGTEYISGSQDHLGLLLPGINNLYYNGKYWPNKIETIVDKNICNWLENVLWLLPMESRPSGYNPLKIINKNPEYAKQIANASNKCWKGILNKNIKLLGEGLTQTMYGWKNLLPYTVPDELQNIWKTYSNYDLSNGLSYGCLFTGAGGGFLMIISDKNIKKYNNNAFQITINTKSWCNKIGNESSPYI